MDEVCGCIIVQELVQALRYSSRRFGAMFRVGERYIIYIYTMPGGATVFNSYLHPGIRGKIGSCNYLNEWQQRQERLVPSDIMFSPRCSPSRGTLPLIPPRLSLLSHYLLLSALSQDLSRR